MRRSSLLACLALIAAACGGGSAAPTTTTTTTTAVIATTAPTTTTVAATTTQAPPPEPTTTIPAPVDPLHVMTLDGFGDLGVLGDAAQDVFDAFEGAFGTPTADSGWLAPEAHGCDFAGPMRTVTWIDPGVRLTFMHGQTAVGAGQHLAHYSTVLPVDPPWEMDGVRRGMTLDDVRVLFPEAEVVEGPALDSIRFVPTVDSFASIDAAGEIREFWAGPDVCSTG